MEPPRWSPVKWLKIKPGDPLPEWHDGKPPCARCGHPAAAHDPDDLSCMVNAHDGAEGPECECEGYVEDLDGVEESGGQEDAP